MSRKIETTLLVAIGIVYFVYLFLRAWYIPMTQDEVATCYNHVPRGVFDLMTYEREAVPNNHILNTLAIKLLAGVFGMGQMVARMPALAGGALYIISAAAFVRLIGTNGWLRLIWFLIFLGNPFMAEFFALARGYGISIGLMMAAIYFTWQYLENARFRDITWSLVFAGLAVMANFTLLNMYLPLALLLLLAILQQEAPAADRRKATGFLVAGVLTLAALCALPVYRMQAGDELMPWGSTGFYPETLAPLVRSSIMDHPYLDDLTVPVLTKLIIVFSLIAWAVAVWRWGNRRWRVGTDPLVFAGFLLAGTVTVNLLQNFFLNVPFLNARTAVFLYPIFALQLVATGELLWRQWGKRALFFVVPLSVFTLINFDNNRNLVQSYEWRYDRGTFTVLDFIKKIYEDEGRTTPFSLDANWLLLNSLHFHEEFARPPYRQWVITPSQYHGDQPPKGDTDFFYTATPEDIEALKDTYEAVLTIERGKFVLMRRVVK